MSDLLKAAKKALGVMESLGWHRAILSNSESVDEAIEAQAAYDAYIELRHAIRGVDND